MYLSDPDIFQEYRSIIFIASLILDLCDISSRLDAAYVFREELAPNVYVFLDATNQEICEYISYYW